MKPISELSHYEVLEISPDAPVAEIERAYQVARAAWATDSLAAYSLYEEQEAAAIRERVETAWRVLSDADQRRVYDDQREPETGPQGHEIAVSIDLALEADSAEHAPVQTELGSLDVFDEEAGSEFSGAYLRRARLQRGVDLEQVSEVTKVSAAYLQFIEEERYVDLPATVYIRGFVAAYARCLGLDPERVAPSYVERLRKERDPEVVTTRPRRRRRGLLRR